MVRGNLLVVVGSHHNLIKLGFEEIVQWDMDSLEGGEDELWDQETRISLRIIVRM